MDDARREQLQPVFDGLDPQAAGIMPFPAKDDDGDGDGSDRDLGSIIFYGATCSLTEDQLEFAIKLGRKLQELDL